MLRALLLLACTAKVAAFAQAPAGEPGCVDLDPEVIRDGMGGKGGRGGCAGEEPRTARLCDNVV